MVIIDVQRAGPSTGMPTKTEQSDLLQALYGRHGESPLPVLAASTPGDCFEAALRGGADRGQLPHAGDPAERPLPRQLRSRGRSRRRRRCPRSTPPSRTRRATATRSCPTRATSAARGRGRSRARPAWRTASAAWRSRTARATISYDGANHARMTEPARGEGRAASRCPTLEVDADEGAELLVLGWGSSYGTIRAGARRVRERRARSPAPTCTTSIRCRRTSASCCAPTSACSCRR